MNRYANKIIFNHHSIRWSRLAFQPTWGQSFKFWYLFIRIKEVTKKGLKVKLCFTYQYLYYRENFFRWPIGKKDRWIIFSKCMTWIYILIHWTCVDFWKDLMIIDCIFWFCLFMSKKNQSYFLMLFVTKMMQI